MIELIEITFPEQAAYLFADVDAMITRRAG
jgi:hypothetical protein